MEQKCPIGQNASPDSLGCVVQEERDFKMERGRRKGGQQRQISATMEISETRQRCRTIRMVEEEIHNYVDGGG